LSSRKTGREGGREPFSREIRELPRSGGKIMVLNSNAAMLEHYCNVVMLHHLTIKLDHIHLHSGSRLM
jgi:hypothetical protein